MHQHQKFTHKSVDIKRETAAPRRYKREWFYESQMDDKSARKALEYLEKEEIVLTGMKEAVLRNLELLQMNEMNLRIVYHTLKNKRKNETKEGKKEKGTKKIKTEPVPPKQMISSYKETLDLKSLHHGPISKAKRNAEELQLETCHVDVFSDSETDIDEIEYQFLEPLNCNSEDENSLTKNSASANKKFVSASPSLNTPKKKVFGTSKQENDDSSEEEDDDTSDDDEKSLDNSEESLASTLPLS